MSEATTGPETSGRWSTTLTAWFEADNSEDAGAIVNRLSERLIAHPCVDTTEADAPQREQPP